MGTVFISDDNLKKIESIVSSVYPQKDNSVKFSLEITSEKPGSECKNCDDGAKVVCSKSGCGKVLNTITFHSHECGKCGRGLSIKPWRFVI